MPGAGTIIAVDLSDYRLHFAKRLGADHGINAGKVAKTERLRMIKEWTHGRGADVVIECAGVPQAVPEALEMLRVGGLLVEAGNFSDLGEVSLSPHRHVCAKNARILAVGGEEPAADGALHETLPVAGICYPPVWLAGRRSGNAKIGRSRIHEGRPGAVAVSAQDL